MYRPIARQRLGRQIPADVNCATIGRPFLGNGAVNKLGIVGNSVFDVVHAEMLSV
jgi:hypothetical protein